MPAAGKVIAKTARCPRTHLAPRMRQQPLSWYSLASCIFLHCEVPRMEKTVERGSDWAALPVIATVAPLLRQDRHRDCARNTGYRPTAETLAELSYRRPTQAGSPIHRTARNRRRRSADGGSPTPLRPSLPSRELLHRHVRAGSAEGVRGGGVAQGGNAHHVHVVREANELLHLRAADDADPARA